MSKKITRKMMVVAALFLVALPMTAAQASPASVPHHKIVFISDMPTTELKALPLPVLEKSAALISAMPMVEMKALLFSVVRGSGAFVAAMATEKSTPPENALVMNTEKSTPSENALVINTDGTVAQTSAENKHRLIAKIPDDIVSTPVPSSSAATFPASSTVINMLAKNANTAKRSHTATLVASLSKQLNTLQKTAWVVRVGSFQNQDNVVRLVKTLRAKGYKVFTHATKNHRLTSVFVGPEFQHEAAARLADDLGDDMHTPGMIVPYAFDV